MSTRKLWDYTIDIKKEFVPRKRKVYPLSREEREVVCEFISKQLRKRYIIPSKLPQIVLVFFVRKIVRSKWCRTIGILMSGQLKNNYPLPLILDIIENIGMKRVFTKIDLR